MLPCVYFVKHKGLDPVKIGFTENIQMRMSSMGTMSPYDLVLLGHLNTAMPEYLAAEIHEKFAHKRLKGEWFDITKDDVVSTIKFYDDDYDNKLNRAMLYLSQQSPATGYEDHQIVERIVELVKDGYTEKRDIVMMLQEELGKTRATVFNLLKRLNTKLSLELRQYKVGAVVHYEVIDEVLA